MRQTSQEAFVTSPFYAYTQDPNNFPNHNPQNRQLNEQKSFVRTFLNFLTKLPSSQITQQACINLGIQQFQVDPKSIEKLLNRTQSSEDLTNLCCKLRNLRKQIKKLVKVAGIGNRQNLQLRRQFNQTRLGNSVSLSLSASHILQESRLQKRRIGRQQLLRMAIQEEINYKTTVRDFLSKSRIKDNVDNVISKRIEKAKTTNKRVQLVFARQKEKDNHQLEENLLQRIQKQPSKSLSVPKSSLTKGPNLKKMASIHQDVLNYNQQKICLPRNSISKGSFKDLSKDLRSFNSFNERDDIRISYMARSYAPETPVQVSKPIQTPNYERKEEITRSHQKVRQIQNRKESLENQFYLKNLKHSIEKELKIQRISENLLNNRLKKRARAREIATMHITSAHQVFKSTSSKDSDRASERKQIFLKERVNRIKQTFKKELKRRERLCKSRDKYLQDIEQQNKCQQMMAFSSLKQRNRDKRQYHIRQLHQHAVERQEVMKQIGKLRQLSLSQLQIEIKGLKGPR